MGRRVGGKNQNNNQTDRTMKEVDEMVQWHKR
jgi:hypothetical protein